MKKVHLLFIACALFFLSCTQKIEGVELYNPYDSQIELTIDEEKHQISSGSSHYFTGEAGEHSVKVVLKDSTVMDTSFMFSELIMEKGAFLNIGRNEIYILHELYGGSSILNATTFINEIYDCTEEQLADQEFLDSLADFMLDDWGVPELNRQSYTAFVIDSFLLTGTYDKIEATEILIPKTWDYNANQEFPVEIEVSDSDGTKSAFGVSKSKIFTKDGLLEYYMNNYY